MSVYVCVCVKVYVYKYIYIYVRPTIRNFKRAREEQKKMHKNGRRDRDK